METPLTEFIALCSVKAEELTGRAEVPEGAVEKMLAVASGPLGLQIENIERVFYRRGERSNYLAPTLLVQAPPINLKMLTSRYFESGNGVFRARPVFRKVLPVLARAEHFGQYESVVEELTRIRGMEGGIRNLIFLSLTCPEDGGIAQVCADLELIQRDLWEFVRTEYHLEQRTRPKRPEVAWARVLDTHRALKEKVGILRSAADFRMESIPKLVETEVTPWSQAAE